MASEGYNGWRNAISWRVALVIDNNEGYYDMAMDWANECAEAGMPYEDAKNEVAHKIRFWVEDEIFDLRGKASPLVMELLYSINPYDIDYLEIADRLMVDYAPKNKSGSKPTVSQNAKRKPVASRAAKPKAATNKRPAQSKAAPKKAGTARRR